MKITITHVEAGAGSSMSVETDQGIKLWITVEDRWTYDGTPGEAVVSVVGEKGVGLVGEVSVPRGDA